MQAQLALPGAMKVLPPDKHISRAEDDYDSLSHQTTLFVSTSSAAAPGLRRASYRPRLPMMIASRRALYFELTISGCSRQTREIRVPPNTRTESARR